MGEVAGNSYYSVGVDIAVRSVNRLVTDVEFIEKGESSRDCLCPFLPDLGIFVNTTLHMVSFSSLERFLATATTPISVIPSLNSLLLPMYGCPAQ